MNNLTDIFNNREIATFIWILVFIIVFVLKKKLDKKIRSSMVSIIKIFFKREVLALFLLLFLYIYLQVFILYKINLWDIALLKDTIYWIVFVAVVLLINVSDASKDSGYFKGLLFNNIKFIIVLEFIVNLYTFPFIVEIILFPIVSLSVIIAALTDKQAGNTQVSKMANTILGLIGFVVIVFSIVNIANDFSNFWTFDSLQAFILPVLLGITFIPFMYLVAIYMAYNSLFRRLKFFLKSSDNTLRYAKRKIFALCRFNLRKLNQFMTENARYLYQNNKIEDIDRIISGYKKGMTQ